MLPFYLQREFSQVRHNWRSYAEWNSRDRCQISLSHMTPPHTSSQSVTDNSSKTWFWHFGIFVEIWECSVLALLLLCMHSCVGACNPVYICEGLFCTHTRTNNKQTHKHTNTQKQPTQTQKKHFHWLGSNIPHPMHYVLLRFCLQKCHLIESLMDSLCDYVATWAARPQTKMELCVEMERQKRDY